MLTLLPELRARLRQPGDAGLAVQAPGLHGAAARAAGAHMLPRPGGRLPAEPRQDALRRGGARGAGAGAAQPELPARSAGSSVAWHRPRMIIAFGTPGCLKQGYALNQVHLCLQSPCKAWRKTKLISV